MAFNIIAESSNSLDFTLLHKEIYKDNLPFDFIPMKGLGIKAGDTQHTHTTVTKDNIICEILIKVYLIKVTFPFLKFSSPFGHLTFKYHPKTPTSAGLPLYKPSQPLFLSVVSKTNSPHLLYTAK